jgi:sugar O-acyltransferase (sialic acid O-acetyltransferase NeuD family)
MIIFGASGHAKVLIDCLLSQNLQIDCIFDDDLNKSTLLGFKVKGKYDINHLKNEPIIIAIGDNKIRENIVSKISHSFGKVYHSSAIVSTSASVENGTVVFQNAVIQSDAIIGKHCIINTSANVDHDCIIEDFVHLAPNVTVCGGVKIGKGTLIGAGSVILPNISIGHNVIVGAGSVVTQNISNNSIVFGNPAKKHE